MNYAVPFAGGLLLLLSFVGWGALLHRWLRIESSPSLSELCGWGLSLLIALGGVLNLLGWISKPLLIFQLALGLAGFIGLVFIPRKKLLSAFISRSPLLIGLGSLLGLLLLITYASWVISPMNTHDDYQAYFVFPLKMIQMGSLGFEPFSERRFHLLGGLPYLQSMVLCFSGLKSLHLIDPGIAILLLAGLLWSYSRKLNVPAGVALAILIVCFLVRLPGNIFEGGGNTSAKVLGPALFLSLILATQYNTSALLSGLLLAGLSSCKNYFPIYGVFYLGVYFLTALATEEDKKAVLKRMSGTAIFSLLFLSPWLAASAHDIGTPFYPVLGKGFHRAAYGFPDYETGFSWQPWKYLWDQRFLALTAFVILGWDKFKKSELKNSLAVLISFAFGLYVVSVLSKNNGRYWFPFYWEGVAFLTMKIFSSFSFREKVSYRHGLALICLIFILWGWRKQIVPFQAGDQLHLIREGLVQTDHKFLEDEGAASYRFAQESIPSGKPVVVRASHPYLMNFKRNPIWNAEYLALGPPPGMPVFSGGEKVGSYLLSQGIQYVFYSYGDQGGFPSIHSNPRMEDRSPWIRTQYRFMAAFQDDLNELAQAKKKIYEDKNIVVLNLAESAGK